MNKERWGFHPVYIKAKLTKIMDVEFDLDIICSFFLSEMMENCDDDLICRVVELTDSGVKQKGI